MRHFSWEDDSTSNSGVQITAITVLRIFAWLDLVAGIALAIIIWVKFSATEIGTGTYYAHTITNPIAIAVGIAVLLQGMFVCALFLVIASIAENLIAIRENTTPKSN
jgi:hypothetical protein